MPIKPIPAECLPALLAAVQNEAGGEIREASALRSRTTRYYLDRRGQVYSGSWVGGAPRVNRRRLSGASGLVVSTAGGPSHHSVRTLYADVWGTDHPDVAARKRTDLLRARDARRAARDARTARVKAERIGWVIAEIVTGLYTPADLARESGVHPSTLTRLVSGEIKELRPETVASLLHGRSVLVVRAGADPSARLRPPPSSDDGSPLWRAAEQARRILERAERPLTKRELSMALEKTPRHTSRIIAHLRQRGVPVHEERDPSERRRLVYSLPARARRAPIAPVLLDREALAALYAALSDVDGPPAPLRRAIDAVAAALHTEPKRSLHR